MRVSIWRVSKETLELRGPHFLRYGPMAEWLGKGLQNLLQQFNSASDLYCRVPANISTPGWWNWYTQGT